MPFLRTFLLISFLMLGWTAVRAEVWCHPAVTRLVHPSD